MPSTKKLLAPAPGLHGHNYTLDVTVTGPAEPVTGMICDLQALNAAVQKHLLDYVDHCNLDGDVDFLQGKISTVETLAQVFADRLAPEMPGQARLVRLRIAENENNAATYELDASGIAR